MRPMFDSRFDVDMAFCEHARDVGKMAEATNRKHECRFLGE